jgi:hypothetical protein
MIFYPPASGLRLGQAHIKRLAANAIEPTAAYRPAENREETKV